MKRKKKQGNLIKLSPIEVMIEVIEAVAKANKTRGPVKTFVKRLRSAFGELSWGEQDWLRATLTCLFIDFHADAADPDESDRRATLPSCAASQIRPRDLKYLRLLVDHMRMFLMSNERDMESIRRLAAAVDDHDRRCLDTKLPDIANEVVVMILGFGP